MKSNLAQKLTSDPISRLELSIRCNNLLNKDLTSKSDPCCVLMMNHNGVWNEMGRTEIIQNSLNPQFAKSLNVDYFFEEVQKVKLMVYDVDNATPQLSDDDFLGQIECTLGEIVSGSPFTRPLYLKGTTKAGTSTITICSTEATNSNQTLMLYFCAKGLDNKDFLGKSDPYLEFSRRLTNGSYQIVHRTEVINNDLNPKWRPIEISVNKMCGGNVKEPIRVECFDHDNDGSHDFIGSFETSVEEMMTAEVKQLQWPCINAKKKAKSKKYQNSGNVYLTNCKITKNFSFLEYIFGGLQLNFTVGIDFTASNGNPSQPTSLHYLSPNQYNQYMKAIYSVGQVIQDYDSDQMFPALGYGAKIPPKMEVSHCFPLNFNAVNPFCAGINGVLEAYKMCLHQIQLYGPTNFAPIIYHIAQFAMQAHNEKKAKNFYILLIITDGVISDIQETIKAIVYSSILPMSIIIVGVGIADFQAMDVLDGDNGTLQDYSGNRAKRDIVQFVPFRNFENASAAALAKQVLAEVPDHVVAYFKMFNIEPEKPKPYDPNQVPAVPLDPNQPGQQPVQPGQVPTGVPGHPGQYPSVQPGQLVSGPYTQGIYPQIQPGESQGNYPGPGSQNQPGQNSQGLPGFQVGGSIQSGSYPQNQVGTHVQPSQYQSGSYSQGQSGGFQGQPGQYPPGPYSQVPPGQFTGPYPTYQQGQPGQYPQGQPGMHSQSQPGQQQGYPGIYNQNQPGYPGVPAPYPGSSNPYNQGSNPAPPYPVGIQSMHDYISHTLGQNTGPINNPPISK